MKKRLVRFLDDWTDSTIVFEGDSTPYEFLSGGGEPDMSIRLRDCAKQVTFHDFGDSRENMNKKLDNLINALQTIKKDCNELYDDWEYQKEQRQKEKALEAKDTTT